MAELSLLRIYCILPAGEQDSSAKDYLHLAPEHDYKREL